MITLNRYFLSLVILIGFFFSLDAKADTYWNDIPKSNIQSSGERLIIPEKYRTVTLNTAEIKNILSNAPLEKNVRPANSNAIVTLPMPDGRNLRFRFVESPVMEDALSAQFPEIKTYMGQGIDDPYTSVRFDLTPLGFHAMIFTIDDIVFIDPYAKNDNFNYISYYRSEFKNPINKDKGCQVIDELDHKNLTITHNDFMAEGQLRTYRTVIACTGEYAAFFGGTAALAQAAIVVSLNRVNGVYEKEVSVRMILVANNISVVYTNSTTDPYTNNNGSTMLGQNQTTVDNIIGTANYDIGHVFSTGGGGVAGLGVVCLAGQKARGVTGSGSPVGDPYDIDYVAHEMGHQFGGNHTFNSVTSSCNGNRSGNAAYEPGSGSTIMAYAGICGSTNLQSNSDAYFHSKSLDEIITYTTMSGGNTCAVITNTGNHNPVVTMPADGFAIPISTPFELTGSATDADVIDVLSYCWEQYDLGPSGIPTSPSGNAPIFRSFNPVATGYRVFPKLSNLLNNTTTIGEILPTYERALTFRLIARDNRVGGGGVGSGTINFGVDASAGPFLVTAPNTNVTWNTPYPQTVTWNVANTNAATVNCANVTILLSTDGGNTFPTVLLASTPNDGSQAVTLPMVNSTTARIKVKALGNVFFDISNTNFTMSTATGIGNNTSAPLTFKLDQNFPNPFNPSTMINFTIPKMSNVTLKVYDLKGQLVATLLNNELRTEGNYAVEFDAAALASGMYFYKLEAGNSIETRKMILMK